MQGMQRKPTTNKTVTHASIWILMPSLKQPSVASFPPVSLGDGRRWTIMNSTGNYSVCMNGTTLKHEWAFVSLWSTVKQSPKNTSELSHEVRTRDTPWRRGNMAKVWACAEHPLQEDWVLLAQLEGQTRVGENSLLSSCRNLDVFVPGKPDITFSSNRTFTDWTFAEELIRWWLRFSLAPRISHNLAECGEALHIYIQNYYNTMHKQLPNVA